MTFLLSSAVCSAAFANWFNQSEKYMATCEVEAARRYHQDISSADVRRHLHLCMIAHGYKLKEFCSEKGWARPDCYRLPTKAEGR